MRETIPERLSASGRLSLCCRRVGNPTQTRQLPTPASPLIPRSSDPDPTHPAICIDPAPPPAPDASPCALRVSLRPDCDLSRGSRSLGWITVLMGREALLACAPLLICPRPISSLLPAAPRRHRLPSACPTMSSPPHHLLRVTVNACHHRPPPHRGCRPSPPSNQTATNVRADTICTHAHFPPS